MTSPSRMLARSAPADPPVEWTLGDLFAVLLRRRAWILWSTALCCALAVAYSLLSTPRYRATAILEVQKESHGAFGLENTTADKSVTDLSDSFDENLALQTEMGILESDSIALDVIQRINLEATPDYFGAHPSHLAWLHRVFFWRKPLEPLTIPLASAPNRRYVALKIFAQHRKVAAAAGTRLIAVSYIDPDPRRAALVANALVQSLSDYTFHSRSSAATDSAAWLQAQLAGLKQQTDALDARAAALDRAAGDFGDTDAHNVVLARLDELNAALSQAESSRIVREAIWRAVESGDPEVISGLGGNPASGPNTQNSFALLQSLRAQEAQVQAQLAESGKRYGDNWPAVAEQRARLATIQQSIQDEVRRLGERAQSDYQVSLQAENSARAAFEQQKALASRLTGDAVALRLARQEADESRALYTTLQGRLQQTGVLEGLHSGNFAIVTPALVPPPDHPSNPSLPLLLVLGLGAGLALGSTAAVVRELTDHAVHSTADLEALLDAPVFAALPIAQPARPWYRRLLADNPGGSPPQLALQVTGPYQLPIPDSPFDEALHRLCATLLLSHSGNAPQVISIASPAPSLAARKAAPEPPLAFSLAAALAQHGYPVLFVDCDLRSAPPPSPAPETRLPGLSEMLSSDVLALPQKPYASLPLLSVVASGPRPPCPSELIASSRMSSLLNAWRQEFGFVLLHSPSVVYADALVLAQLSDAVLLAARAGETRREEVAPAFDSLSRQVPSHAVLGLILDGIASGVPYALA